VDAPAQVLLPTTGTNAETPAPEAGELPARTSRVVSDRRTFFAELRDRSVLRVAVLYIAATWALSQGISQLTPALDLPDGTTRVFLVICAIGFPVALTVAWHFQAILHEIREMVGAGPSTPEATTAGSAPPVTIADPGPAIPRKSVAVLPFMDLSPAHDQEYFSDGVAEEILNALVKLRDLKVAGRTSSFFFKGKNQDLREVGKTLAVAHVLEGSVRKHGDRVRITAQLIQTCDGYHLWSDNFDGDLSDVFELQERIARSIARELDVLLHDGYRLVPVATSDPEAYRLYLQASDIHNRRDMVRMAQAIELLRQAVARDPGFARAHARLASAYAIQPNYSQEAAATALANVMVSADRASELDPTLGEPWSAKALVFTNAEPRFIESREAMEQSLRVQPEDTAVRYWAGAPSLSLGYVGWGCTHLDHLLELDPLYPAAMLWRGVGHLIKGELARAEGMFRKATDLGLAHAGLGMHDVLAARDRLDEAVVQLAHGLVMLAEGLSGEQLTVLAQGAYGDAAARNRMDELINGIVAKQPRWLPGAIPYALLVRGETTRAMELGTRFRSITSILYFSRFWMPSFETVRKSPGFLEFVRQAGLTALWHHYGPPDGARRNTAGEYVWG
jgi:TolB-like protein